MSDVLARIRTGITLGLGMASFYTLYVLGLYILHGTAPFEAHHTTLGAVVTVYFVGGIVAGGIVGALQPLTRWRIGAICVYSLAAFAVFLGFAISDTGSIRYLEGIHWFTCITCGLIFGAYSALVWHGRLFRDL